MAKISMFGIKKATMEASAFLVGEQYTFAKATVEKFKGKIGKTTDGKMRATFASVKIAEACKKELDAWWDSKKTSIGKATVRVNKTAPAPAKGKAKMALEEGKTYTVKNGKLVEVVPTTPAPAKKSAPGRAKSGKKTAPKKPTLEDFIKANPLCTREQAVAHGFKGTKPELRALKVKVLGK